MVDGGDSYNPTRSHVFRAMPRSCSEVVSPITPSAQSRFSLLGHLFGSWDQCRPALGTSLIYLMDVVCWVVHGVLQGLILRLGERRSLSARTPRSSTVMSATCSIKHHGCVCDSDVKPCSGVPVQLTTLFIPWKPRCWTECSSMCPTNAFDLQ